MCMLRKVRSASAFKNEEVEIESLKLCVKQINNVALINGSFFRT